MDAIDELLASHAAASARPLCRVTRMWSGPGIPFDLSPPNNNPSVSVTVDAVADMAQAAWRWNNGRCVFTLLHFHTASDFRVSGATPGTRVDIETESGMTLSTATVDHSGCCVLLLFLLPAFTPYRPLQLVAHGPRVCVAFTTTICSRETYARICKGVREGAISARGIVQGRLYTYCFSRGLCGVQTTPVPQWLLARELGQRPRRKYK